MDGRSLIGGSDAVSQSQRDQRHVRRRQGTLNSKNTRSPVCRELTSHQQTLGNPRGTVQSFPH